MKDELNKSLITRLVKYQRVLRKLKSMGFVQVFSNNLADAIGVSPATVRKDFSLINVPGNKRGGYQIDTLTTDLGKVLGVTKDKDVILVGCGRIGHALMNYSEFAKEGIRIVAGFDANVLLHNDQASVPIYPMSEIRNYIVKHRIEVGVIAVPENSATQVFDEMIKAGIKGILNFTSVELKCHGRCERSSCPNRCSISNVNIGLELENIFHLVTMESRDRVSIDISQRIES